MNKRHLSILVAMLVLSAAGHASAEAVAATDTGGTTVRLDSRVQLWVNGDGLGPAKVEKNTGAGVMDANFTFDTTTPAKALYGTEVLLGTTYTRSANTPNGDNSYMQGGFALAKLTDKGLTVGQPVDLPALDGERAFMRPLIAFTPKFVVIVAASEDNDTNNGNPKPVLYLADKVTGALVTIPNNPRGANKPIDLISVGTKAGIAIDNPDNQRGPHKIVPISDDSFLVGTQYNNQSQEVFRITVAANGTVSMNWLERYSNNAVHNRPQVSYTAGAPEGYMTAIECNAQPANVGIRLTKFDVNTGKTITTKVVVAADPAKNRYVSEPHIVDLGDRVGLLYGITALARPKQGNNGHAGGANVSHLALYNKTDLAQIGEPLVAPANYQRHPGAFSMKYGAGEQRAIGVISGSSTGTAKGLLQVIPLNPDGTLGTKDPLKVYTVSTYSDVANLQARGKRNPNNQAKGFINGVGDVPNPGFGKPGGFYPEVKSFSFSTVTGYSGPDAMAKGLKESLWLSLVPATWKEGISTVPGGVSETAGNQPAAQAPTPDPNSAGKPQGATGALAPVDSSGCSVTDARGIGDAATFAPVAGLGLALVLAARRRRAGSDSKGVL